MSTASEEFLIFTTQPYQYFSVFFIFALFSDNPEVFLPKYFQTATRAAHFWRVVKKLEKWHLSEVISPHSLPIAANNIFS